MTASELLPSGGPEIDLPAAAAALAPQLRERAVEASAAGTLPGDVVDLLESAGMFRLGLPRGLGGVETDPTTLVRTIETLAHADGSAAWTTAVGNISTCFAWLDQDVAARLLAGRPGQPVASAFGPNGRAVAQDGGYRVSGRWSYVSGSPHAASFMLNCVVTGRDGAPQTVDGRPVLRWAVLPASAVEVLSTWNDAAGLRGTGTHDVVVEDVFVPAECTLLPLVEPPRAEGALYRVPFFTLIRSLLVGVPLGAARRALDELTELCRHKIREGTPLVHDEDVQIRLAQAEGALRAGRHFVLDVTERTWAAVQAGAEVEPPLRTEYTLAVQVAVRSAVEAVDMAFEVAGVSSALAGDVIQRCWRDVNVAKQQVALARHRWRAAGQALLGLDVDPLYL